MSTPTTIEPTDAELDFIIRRGTTLPLTFDYTDADGKAVDMTGWESKLQVRSEKDNELLFEMGTDVGGITLNSDGTIDWIVEAADSAGFEWDRGRYDWLMIDAQGHVSALASGVWKIVDSITEL